METNYTLFVENLLKENAYWVVNKAIAKEIGLLESVLLSDLISKQKFHRENNNLNDGYFFATIESIESDTTIKRSVQNRIISKLKKLELIQVVNKGIPAKRYFKINHESIYKLLTNKYVEQQQTSMSKNDKLYCRKTTNKDVEIQQSNYKNKTISNKDKNKYIKEWQIKKENYDEIKWNKYLELMTKYSRIQKMQEPLTFEQIMNINEKYKIYDLRLETYLASMHNYKKLLTNSVSANLTLQNWINRDIESGKIQKRDKGIY